LSSVAGITARRATGVQLVIEDHCRVIHAIHPRMRIAVPASAALRARG